VVGVSDRDPDGAADAPGTASDPAHGATDDPAGEAAGESTGEAADESTGEAADESTAEPAVVPTESGDADGAGATSSGAATAGGTATAADGPDADDGGRSRVRRGIDYALLAGLGLLAFIAVVQFYLAVDATITQWVTREYRAPFRAVFNLAVLLVAGAGIYRQMDRIAGGDARSGS
jgi:hypothetical protein